MVSVYGMFTCSLFGIKHSLSYSLTMHSYGIYCYPSYSSYKGSTKSLLLGMHIFGQRVQCRTCTESTYSKCSQYAKIVKELKVKVEKWYQHAIENKANPPPKESHEEYIRVKIYSFRSLRRM